MYDAETEYTHFEATRAQLIEAIEAHDAAHAEFFGSWSSDLPGRANVDPAIERRFREARDRLGKMLVGTDVPEWATGFLHNGRLYAATPGGELVVIAGIDNADLGKLA